MEQNYWSLQGVEALEPFEPGLYPDLPAPHYHRMGGASASRLKKLSISPAHLLLSMTEEQVSSPAMEFGTLFHSRILEPDRFARDYVVSPKFDGRTNLGKQAKANFELDNLGKKVVNEADASTLEGMYDSLMANPEIRLLLESAGPVEASMFWDDPETGVRCKGRMDKRPEIGGQKIVLDLKSTKDASPKGFAKEIANLQYHIQAAYYLDGATLVTGEEHLGFAFLAVEKEPPYPFGLYLLDEQSIEAGRRERQRLLAIWKRCFETGNFPHYTDSLAESALQEISLPYWALREAGL